MSNTVTVTTSMGKYEVPVIPALPKEPEKYPRPGGPFNHPVAVCGECGITLFQVMSYVCGRPNCPTGLGNRVTC